MKKDKVAVVLVTMPDHIGTFQTYLDYGRFIREYKDLLEKLDYDSPSLFPMDDRNCFLNGGYGVANSHLSAKGAEIFGRMFARDLKKVLDAVKRPQAVVSYCRAKRRPVACRRPRERSAAASSSAGRS